VGRTGRGASLAGAGTPARTKVTVSTPPQGPLEISGTLNTPWGPAHVEGIARTVARQEIDADRDFDYKLSNR
jgi:hypothetical protein